MTDQKHRCEQQRCGLTATHVVRDYFVVARRNLYLCAAHARSFHGALGRPLAVAL